MPSSTWQQTDLDLQNFSPTFNDELPLNYPFSTDISNGFMMEGEENNELTKPPEKYKSTTSESSNMQPIDSIITQQRNDYQQINNQGLLGKTTTHPHNTNQ